MVICFMPEEILQSELLLSFIKSHDENEMQQMQEGWNKVREYCGIDPMQDIDQVIIMSEDMRKPRQSASAIILGDFRNLLLDSLLLLQEHVRMDTMNIQNQDVISFVSREKERNRLLAALTDSEIMLALDEERMERMLALKNGDAKSLEHSRIAERFQDIPYSSQAWCMLPLGNVMDDVLDKARKLKPDYDLSMMQISHIQGD
jgi:hypothetical protein